ncbi:cathepsin L-like proteinase [Choristoneura fumiferana]|uniref:cathepsin L-like proteinase n=1 Tax=Choristoneura fumiferana TaxID=7141 RepID=UPI003D155BA7
MGGRCVLILLCVAFSHGFQLMEDEPVEELSWPPEFHFKAEKIDFKSGIVEPQELWSSDTYNRSRIDYYGGEVKKYYYWETDDEPGYVVNVNHVSTEDYHNVLTCQRWYMKSELQKPLPEPEEFEYTGEQELEGRWVQVWQHNVVYKEHFWKERTLYTYIDDGFHIPVQQVRKLFFTKKASLSTHVITNYYSYNSTVEEEDLDVKIIVSTDQAQCGSCWAFSSTAAVEGALARSNGGRILDLSEQALVDCAWGFGNRGCHGGDMQMAFMYLTKHGISLDEEYGPYLEQDGLCHMDNMTTVFSVRGYSVVTKRNPEALRVALYKYGPTAVSIHFSRKMAFYASGIFYDPICNDGYINHGVTAVGYGVRDGTPYWIIKNSHGQDWGQAGYILLSALDNNCFTLDEPVYPIV